MKHIYYRVSTDAQDFAQQKKVVADYLQHLGIDAAAIASETVEKVSGTIDYKERRLSTLLNNCKAGDVIYISELSRLGRNMANLFEIVSNACDRGIIIVQCKDGTTIESKSIGGKALLFALSLAAEIEVANIRQRTMAGLAARKDKLARDGFAISNAGRMYTHFGREKGADVSAAVAAASANRSGKAATWRKNSVAYKAFIKKTQEGATNKQILQFFEDMYEIDPENYCTSTGAKVTGYVLTRWRDFYKKELITYDD
jgi:DNA invertase Pin-like site-specific DNA recombinase